MFVFTFSLKTSSDLHWLMLIGSLFHVVAAVFLKRLLPYEEGHYTLRSRLYCDLNVTGSECRLVFYGRVYWYESLIGLQTFHQCTRKQRSFCTGECTGCFTGCTKIHARVRSLLQGQLSLQLRFCHLNSSVFSSFSISIITLIQAPISAKHPSSLVKNVRPRFVYLYTCINVDMP